MEDLSLKRVLRASFFLAHQLVMNDQCYFKPITSPYASMAFLTQFSQEHRIFPVSFPFNSLQITAPERFCRDCDDGDLVIESEGIGSDPYIFTERSVTTEVGAG